MINSIGGLHNQRRLGEMTSVKKDSSFDDFLVNSSTETAKERTIADEAIDEMKKQLGLYNYNEESYDIPNRWVENPNTGTSKKFGWVEAEKYLKSIGIDTDKIQGTHTLTAEQKDWIKSRTNLDAVVCHSTNAEYENLLGDLVVLGVLTPNEAKNLFAVKVPPGNGSILPVSETEMQSLASGLGIRTGNQALFAMRDSISLQNSLMDNFLSQKGGILLDPTDKEFVRQASELLSLKQSFYDLMMDLFD